MIWMFSTRNKKKSNNKCCMMASEDKYPSEKACISQKIVENVQFKQNIESI